MSKKVQSIFFLTQLQEKVFFALAEEPLSVSEVALKAKVPRTSVSKALLSLEDFGIVHGRKIKNKNKHLYHKATYAEINAAIESVRLSMLGKLASDKIKFTTAHDSQVVIFSGKESIIEALHGMLSIRKSERVYVVQGKDAMASWLSFIGEEETLLLQEKIKKNEIIIVSVRGENFKKEVSSHEKIKGTYRGRMASAYAISDEFFEEGTSLYAFQERLFFVNLKKSFAIEIHDKEITKSFMKLINYILTQTNRDNLIID